MPSGRLMQRWPAAVLSASDKVCSMYAFVTLVYGLLLPLLLLYIKEVHFRGMLGCVAVWVHVGASVGVGTFGGCASGGCACLDGWVMLRGRRGLTVHEGCAEPVVSACRARQAKQPNGVECGHQGVTMPAELLQVPSL